MNHASEIEKEIRVLSELDHENIVTLIGIKTVENEKYMIMEYMNSRDLLSYLRSHENLTEIELFEIAEQVCAGMAYLEEKNVIHKYSNN